ncbi:hypothetical protein LP420_11690 [Massilia sp. B-10]|nr:hypothetical protein LP420_11690 [Massilia sp. B-10]
MRLHQLLTNLLINAAQYGTDALPVRMAAAARRTRSRSRSSMTGPASRPSRSKRFSARWCSCPAWTRMRARVPAWDWACSSREIALAHGGGISAASSEAEGTVFTVIVPRGSGPSASRPG